VAALVLRELGEPVRGQPGVADGTVRQLDVLRHGKYGAGDRRHVRLRQGSLEEVAGQGGVAPGQVNRRQRPQRVGALIEPVEQFLGLLQPALARPQVGQAHQGGAAHPCPTRLADGRPR
jgi:hypothetical protein